MDWKFIFSLVFDHLDLLSLLYFSTFLFPFFKKIFPIFLKEITVSYRRDLDLLEQQNNLYNKLQKEDNHLENRIKSLGTELEDYQKKEEKIQEKMLLSYKALCHQYDSHAIKYGEIILLDQQKNLFASYLQQKRGEVEKLLLQDSIFLGEFKKKFSLESCPPIKPKKDKIKNNKVDLREALDRINELLV